MIPQTLMSLAVLCVCAAPQQPKASEPRPVPALDAQKEVVEYTSVAQIGSARVYLSASPDPQGGNATESAKRPTAQVADWLIDRTTGKTTFAVVNFGGFLGIGDKSVLLPAKDLKWNHAMERFDLDWTVEALKAQANFDLDAACKAGLDVVCGDKGAPVTTKATAEASMREGARIEGTTFVATEDRLYRASQLAKLPVYATSNECGKVTDLIIDRKSDSVILAVVNHGSTLGLGGKDCLIPFARLRLVRASGAPAYCLEATTLDDLGVATAYEKPKNGVVDPAVVKPAGAWQPRARAEPAKKD